MTEEKIIVGKGTKYPLNGLLTLPAKGKQPFPAVVFVHGSGSSNMDEKVMKLTPFRDLAHGLAAHGIASVRYDKRSFAHAFKLVREKALTVKEETIEDAVLAAELLREDARIDPERIFIIGHSMGAMLAPRIDAEGGNFRGLIMMAGTLRKLEEILVEQMHEMLAEMPALLRKMAGKSVRKMEKSFEGLYEMSDEEAKKKKFGGGTTLYYFKEMGEHPATEYLKQSQKPMLILQGEKDVQVKISEYEAYRALLGERENVQCKLYEGLNHAFVPSVYGLISKAKKEYNVEQHIGEEVIADIAAWIHAVN